VPPRPAPAAERTLASAAQSVEHRRALADRTRRSLHDELLPWYSRAADRERAELFSQFDDAWNPTGKQDTMIATQARHVWTTARAVQPYPQDTTLLRAATHAAASTAVASAHRPGGGFHEAGYHYPGRAGIAIVDHTTNWWGGRRATRCCVRWALEGQIWKAAYHDGRALVNVSRRLDHPGGAR
jgi:hypothetical protein